MVGNKYFSNITSIRAYIYRGYYTAARISKSKLVHYECNDLYFIAIAFIAFKLHEIKQSPVFFGTPV